VFYLFIRTTNWPFDWISFGYLLWNFAVCGLVAIFWYAPPKLQQAYLVIISVLMAAVLTQLPEWSTWVVLAIISVYDLFAVLCPKGPLKVLLDTAVERNEHIPALLYSAAVWIFMVRNTAHDAVDDDDARPPKPASRLVVDQDALDIEAVPAPVMRPQQQQQHQQQHQQQQQQQQQHRASGYDAPESMDAPARPASNPNELPAPERRKGIQLGLGDFVFYSVLVGRAALSDMSTVYTCFVAIITGLFLTLLLLDVFKRALPALPISIALGILFYFLTYIFVLPFIVELNRAGVFV
jgi:presenilin 1